MQPLRPNLLLATAVAVLFGLSSLPAQADPPDWAPAHGRRDKDRHSYHDDDDDDHGRRYRKYAPPVYDPRYPYPAPPRYVPPAGYDPRYPYPAPPGPQPPRFDPRYPYPSPYKVPRPPYDPSRPHIFGSQPGAYWGGYDPRYSARYGTNIYGVGEGRCDYARIGGLGGANVGNVLGNAVGNALGQGGDLLLGAIASAVVNQMLGASIGQAMDGGDRSCFSQILEYGYDQRPVAWYNPTTGNQYRMVPMRSYQTVGGGWCREFSYQVTRGGNVLDDAIRTACRMADGNWQ